MLKSNFLENKFSSMHQYAKTNFKRHGKNILANDIKQLHKISVNFTYKEYFKDGNPKSD